MTLCGLLTIVPATKLSNQIHKQDKSLYFSEIHFGKLKFIFY